ncbi:MAG: hypothetical protein ACPG7F_07065 [Aggregatilineales bacterium]
MRFPLWLMILAALTGLGLVLIAGTLILQPPQALILDATFSEETISPNADGDNDITRFAYDLSRGATVSLIFEAADGTVFDFRRDEPRIPQTYSVLFSGVVAGYTLPDENIPGMIERRLIPEGDYTWRFIAENENEREERSGTLTITDADSDLPIINTFTVGPDTFSPNQDGIDDRVEISVDLAKASELRVVLIDENDIETPIAARKEGREQGEQGRHTFDYEGGIDLGADPPPDGTYTLLAVAQDAVGQRIRRETTLTIEQGGKPRAEIAAQSVGVDVVFDVFAYDENYYSELDAIGAPVMQPNDPDSLSLTAITMPIGDVLVFKLTVENYSDVPIRTTGPVPGTVYQQNQLASSLGNFDSSGAWRVGIQCETSSESFPYRWAIGADDVLETVIDDETGEAFKYLPPQSQAVVWGGIRMTDIQERQNPQTCRAGLIHEDVAVSLRNSFVGAREIELVDPGATVDDE